MKQPAPSRPQPRLVLVGGLAMLLFVGLMLARLTASQSATATTPTATITPTPLVSPTPTPFALEAQDEVIQGGDGGREVAYPVNLQVVTGDTSFRVWVVQRRRVQASEWRYDPNPDTASFISGLSVRPVIGVPWSAENAAFFDAMGDGTTFDVTMNTGAVLRFTFADKQTVRRSETALFRQISPGLVLVLMGETDDEGLPTATRTLITATYPPAQELARDGLLFGAAQTTGVLGNSLTLGDATITLHAVRADNEEVTLDIEMAAGS